MESIQTTISPATKAERKFLRTSRPGCNKGDSSFTSAICEDRWFLGLPVMARSQLFADLKQYGLDPHNLSKEDMANLQAEGRITAERIIELRRDNFSDLRGNEGISDIILKPLGKKRPHSWGESSSPAQEPQVPSQANASEHSPQQPTQQAVSRERKVFFSEDPKHCRFLLDTFATQEAFISRFGSKIGPIYYDHCIAIVNGSDGQTHQQSNQSTNSEASSKPPQNIGSAATDTTSNGRDRKSRFGSALAEIAARLNTLRSSNLISPAQIKETALASLSQANSVALSAAKTVYETPLIWANQIIYARRETQAVIGAAALSIFISLILSHRGPDEGSKQFGSVESDSGSVSSLQHKPDQTTINGTPWTVVGETSTHVPGKLQSGPNIHDIPGVPEKTKKPFLKRLFGI